MFHDGATLGGATTDGISPGRLVVRGACACLAVLACITIVPPAAPGATGHGPIRHIAGLRFPSGVTAFRLGALPVHRIVGAHVTFASGHRLELRLRRVRAATRGGVMRLHLGPAAAGLSTVLVLRVDLTPPAAPRAVAATVGDGHLHLRWRHPPGRILRYWVQVDGRQATHTDGAESKVIPGLANGESYSVTVVAVDPAGNVSPPSPPVEATPGPGVPAAPVVCDRFAAIGGRDTAAGTSVAPFATAQHLLDALTPGQTGCLRAGTYRQYELRARHAGTPAAPITLASAPGERATIIVDTDVYLPAGITDVTVRDLDITNNPASGVTQAVMIQDFSDRSVWEYDDINGNSDAHCMELGWAGNATAHDTLIRRNRFHACGNPANGNQDHAIYLSQTVGATITENVFWHTAAYAIHLYPNADDSVVTHNVIVDSGYAGVIFASDQNPGTGRTSDRNTVAYNILADSARFGIEVFWGASGQGTGNSARDNCLSGNAAGPLAGALPGIALSGNSVRTVHFVDAAAHDYRLAPGDPCLGVVQFDTAALLLASNP